MIWVEMRHQKVVYDLKIKRMHFELAAQLPQRFRKAGIYQQRASRTLYQIADGVAAAKRHDLFVHAMRLHSRPSRML